MYAGWAQVAFDEEVAAAVAPVDVGGRRLVAVRGADRVRVYDGTCPHRGAHLGHGGTVEGGALVCPFHGHHIHLGEGGAGPFCVREHASVQAMKGLFVLSDPSLDTGWREFVAETERRCHVVPAFSMHVGVEPEYIIENVFDTDHFAAVHALDRRPELRIHHDVSGVLRIEGALDMARPNQWQREEDREAATQARFCARVFSPLLVATELGPPDQPNVVVTAAVPAPDGGCVVRVTVALPRDRPQGPPTVREVSSLVSGSRTAFEQDVKIWEHLDTSVVPHYTTGDDLVRAFRDYCRAFATAPASAGADRASP